MSNFKKAVKKQVKLKLAMTGPSGAGKTFSALRLAKGLGGKIAFIDTENGSASLYSDKFDFDVLEITPPFTTEKYIAAINDAEKAGYEIIVVDSLTHAWAGEGGLLEQKAQLDARPGSNHWTNWGPIDKKDLALKNALLHSPCHIIATMRSKMEYTQTDDGGKKRVQKLGMAPIQRDGLSYEFTIVFDIAGNNEAEASKDRTGLFVGKYFKITEETGATILKWLSSGAAQAIAQPPAAPPAQPQAKPAAPAAPIAPAAPQAQEEPPIAEPDGSENPEAAADPVPQYDEPKAMTLGTIGADGIKKLRNKLLAVGKTTDWTPDQIGAEMRSMFKVAKLEDLTELQYADLYKIVSSGSPGPVRTVTK